MQLKVKKAETEIMCDCLEWNPGPQLLWASTLPLRHHRYPITFYLNYFSIKAKLASIISFAEVHN